VLGRAAHVHPVLIIFCFLAGGTAGDSPKTADTEMPKRSRNSVTANNKRGHCVRLAVQSKIGVQM